MFMSMGHTHGMHTMSKPLRLDLLWIILAASMLTGCRAAAPDPGPCDSKTGVQRTYRLRHLPLERCEAVLGSLGLEKIDSAPDANSVLLEGTLDQLTRAERVLDVVDVPEDCCVEDLGPASVVRTLPSNSQIAAALGDISIGTFDKPPAAGAGSRAIIDIQGDSVLAFLPVRCREPLRRLLSHDDASAALPKPSRPTARTCLN